MKHFRRLAVVLTALALLLTLAGCGGEEPKESFDPVSYVDGILRAAYLGEYSEEYLEQVGQTQEEAESVYENSIYLEAQVFAYLYNIEYPDDFYEELRELYRQIYAHAKFEVVSATEREDGSFAVRVEVQPIDIVQKVEAKLDQVLKPFFAKYTSEVRNKMSTKDYQAFDAEWARLIIDTYQKTLPETGNLEKVPFAVLLEKNEDGYYVISDKEFQKLDSFIIDYSKPELQPDPETSPDPDATPGPEESLDPDATPGPDDPVPPTTASPLPEPETSAEPQESATPEPEESTTPEESTAPEESPAESE